MSSKFCLKSGIFKGDDVYKVRIKVEERDQFGPCPTCGREIDWSRSSRLRARLNPPAHSP